MKLFLSILILTVSCSRDMDISIIGSVQLEKLPLKITDDTKKLLLSAGKRNIVTLAEKHNLKDKDSVLIKDKQGNLFRVFINKSLSRKIDEFLSKHKKSIISKELYVELKVELLQDEFYLLKKVISINEVDGMSFIK